MRTIERLSAEVGYRCVEFLGLRLVMRAPVSD